MCKVGWGEGQEAMRIRNKRGKLLKEEKNWEARER